MRRPSSESQVHLSLDALQWPLERGLRRAPPLGRWRVALVGGAGRTFYRHAGCSRLVWPLFEVAVQLEADLDALRVKPLAEALCCAASGCHAAHPAIHPADVRRRLRSAAIPMRAFGRWTVPAGRPGLRRKRCPRRVVRRSMRSLQALRLDPTHAIRCYVNGWRVWTSPRSRRATEATVHAWTVTVPMRAGAEPFLAEGPSHSARHVRAASGRVRSTLALRLPFPARQFGAVEAWLDRLLAASSMTPQRRIDLIQALRSQRLGVHRVAAPGGGDDAIDEYIGSWPRSPARGQPPPGWCFVVPLLHASPTTIFEDVDALPSARSAAGWKN